jgi:hypothetical protein
MLAFGCWTKPKHKYNCHSSPTVKTSQKPNYQNKYHHLIFSRLTQRTRGLEKKRIEGELEDPGRMLAASSGEERILMLGAISATHLRMHTKRSRRSQFTILKASIQSTPQLSI